MSDHIPFPVLTSDSLAATRQLLGFERSLLESVRQETAKARQAFTAFVDELRKLLQDRKALPLMLNWKLALEILPVMHTLYPAVAPYTPDNGQWHLGLTANLEAQEFRLFNGKWEVRELATLMVPAPYLVAALLKASEEAKAYNRQRITNTERVATECERMRGVLRSLASST